MQPSDARICKNCCLFFHQPVCLKVHGEKILIIIDSFVCLIKLNKQTLHVCDWIQFCKQTDVKGQQLHAVLLCLYAADPATFLTSVFWGPYFPLRTACLFSCGKYSYFSFHFYLIYMVNIKILFEFIQLLNNDSDTFTEEVQALGSGFWELTS